MLDIWIIAMTYSTGVQCRHCSSPNTFPIGIYGHNLDSTKLSNFSDAFVGNLAYFEDSASLRVRVRLRFFNDYLRQGVWDIGYYIKRGSSLGMWNSSTNTNKKGETFFFLRI